MSQFAIISASNYYTNNSLAAVVWKSIFSYEQNTTSNSRIRYIPLKPWSLSSVCLQMCSLWNEWLPEIKRNPCLQTFLTSLCQKVASFPIQKSYTDFKYIYLAKVEKLLSLLQAGLFRWKPALATSTLLMYVSPTSTWQHSTRRSLQRSSELLVRNSPWDHSYVQTPY